MVNAMDEFDKKKKELLQLLMFEAGAALLDCQHLEYGVALLLHQFARFAQQVANHVAHCGALSAKFNPSAYVHNRDAAYLSSACHHFHRPPPGDIVRLFNGSWCGESKPPEDA
jgi:hypothetical protein